jgi:lysyl-tRNA synthetase class 2
MAEIYEVDLDLDASLDRIERAVRAVVQGVQGSGVVPYQEHKLDFDSKFRRVKVLDALDQSGNNAAREFAAKHRAAEPRLMEGEDRVLHQLLDEYVKPSLVQPTFLTHFPKSADQFPDRFIGNEIQRAELVVACMEVGEVGALQPDGDLLHQHATAAVRDRHGHTASTHLVDVDYLDEIRAFNRPVGGGAIGIDRLLMLLCDTKDMREVVWYPLVGKFHEGR